ncbi:MAG: hypothetical protein J6R27_05880 [Muribaculaceae bacterium]|nr:hypothetical protein [Muribaculaceae bacterium]
MRKILLSLVAIFAALSMTAQSALYATGDFAQSTWDPAYPAQFTYDAGTDLYTLNVTCSQLKISTAKGDWGTFDGAALQASGTIKPGSEYSLSKGTSNILFGWQGDWTITVSLSKMKISATTTTPPPAGSEYPKVYLRGDMNGWGTDAAWEFSTTDGVVYNLENVSIQSTQKFKIADGSWGAINYGGQSGMKPDTEYTLTHNSTDCSLAANFSGSVTFNVNSKKVIFKSGGSPAVDPFIFFDNTETQWEMVYIMLTDKDGNVYSDFPGEEMEFVEDSDNLWCFQASADYPYAQFNDGGDNTTAVCTLKDNYVYSMSNPAGEEYREPIDYSGWYVNVPGDHNQWGDNGVACSSDGVAVLNLTGAKGGFKIKIWNGSEDAWYSNGQTIALDSPVVLNSNSDTNMTFPATADGLGNLTVTFDCSRMTLTITLTAGVDEIELGDVPAEYFNLQGVRVAEPTTGLYIVRRGNNITKEIVR